MYVILRFALSDPKSRISKDTVSDFIIFLFREEFIEFSNKAIDLIAANPKGDSSNYTVKVFNRVKKLVPDNRDDEGFILVRRSHFNDSISTNYKLDKIDISFFDRVLLVEKAMMNYGLKQDVIRRNMNKLWKANYWTELKLKTKNSTHQPIP